MNLKKIGSEIAWNIYCETNIGTLKVFRAEFDLDLKVDDQVVLGFMVNGGHYKILGKK